MLSLAVASTAFATESSFARRVVDAERGRVWTLAPDGVRVHARDGALLRHVPIPGWIVAGEPYGCMPDLALDRWGDAVVTSDVVPVVWKVHAATFAVTRHELVLDRETAQDVGFAALAYSARHGVFFAASFHHGTLWRVDPLLRRAQKVDLPQPLRGVCQMAVARERLCAYTPAEWQVRLAPDLRSAAARRAPCRD
jgi:hypothetical protein